MWQPFLCGDVKGGVYHVRWLQIKRCGELDPEGSPPARLFPAIHLSVEGPGVMF